MASLPPRPTFRLAGLRAEGDGYPNAGRTIALLADAGVEIIDHGRPLPAGLHLWRLKTLGTLGQLRQMSGIALGNAVSLVRLLVSRRGKGSAVYVPYPAIFLMWMLSWLPRRVRPHCIVDAYISVWDASFRDRSSRGESPVARIVRAFEGRALRAGAVVLVDTTANARHFIEDFGIDPARIHAFPLAIDEGRFLAIAPRVETTSDVLRVLFVGTLIPLHGIEQILDAASELAQRDAGIRFRIVGDGQLGGMIERFVDEHPHVALEWVREWCDLDRIAEEIAQADVCLGVFGGDRKAARVLPFKLYMYLAAGRPIISQQKGSTPDDVPSPPIIGVDPAVRGQIAEAILRLAEQAPAERARLGSKAREYYLSHLGNAEVARRWSELQP